MSIQALTNALSIRGIAPSEKLLLLALANYADEHLRCYPSQQRLADDTCLSKRTVRTLLASMEERGMLSRESRIREDGSRGTDIITLHFDRAQISGGGEMVSPPGEAASGGVGKSLPGGGEMVSPLTTFEPSSNLIDVDDSASALDQSDDWPSDNLVAELVEAVASPRLDPAKQPGLTLTAGRIVAWKREGASWRHDVVPVVQALCAKAKGPVSSWKFFDAAIAQAIADNRAALEIPEARAIGPPVVSITDRIAAEQAEARRRAFEIMDKRAARNG